MKCAIKDYRAGADDPIFRVHNKLKRDLHGHQSNNLNANLNCVFYTLVELQFCLYRPAFITSRVSYIFKIVIQGFFKYTNIVCYDYGIFLEILLDKFKILKIFLFCSI